MSRIAVVGLRGVADDVVAQTARHVARTFATDAEAWTRRADLEPLPPDGSERLESTDILRRLLRSVPDPQTRLLGVTETDLYLPTLSFVFGHAQLDGQVAVVSLYRLRPENQFLNPDPERVRSRLRRETSHELGHTYGLRHCTDRSCCMALSTSVDEVDTKSPEFCRTCRALVREAQRHERVREERVDRRSVPSQEVGR